MSIDRAFPAFAYSGVKNSDNNSFEQKLMISAIGINTMNRYRIEVRIYDFVLPESPVENEWEIEGNRVNENDMLTMVKMVDSTLAEVQKPTYSSEIIDDFMKNRSNEVIR